MMQLLREKKIESYSYTPIEHKRSSIVLRGLYYKTDTETIKNEIEFLTPSIVETVSKFTTAFSRKNGFDTGLFLVTLLPGKSNKEITGIKYILNQKISWESPKRNSREIQCWRCQKWGHMSKNCNRPFACVKCDENHAPGECKFISDKDNLPFCNNCKQHGHPSNFRGCSAYKEYVSMKKKMIFEAKERNRKANNNVASILNNNNIISSDKSFASLFHPLKTNSCNDSPLIKNFKHDSPLINEFLKIAKIICEPETLTLENKISKFIKEYKTFSLEEARQQCRCLLVEIQQSYDP